MTASPGSRHRAKGCDVTDEAAKIFFAEVFKVSSRSARSLWRHDTSKSVWENAHTWTEDFRILLTLSECHVPHQLPLHMQFRDWLYNAEMSWTAPTPRAAFTT